VEAACPYARCVADAAVGGRTWWLFEGKDLIGEIRNCGFYDMFWTRGGFRARGCFEQDFRAAFDDYMDARASADKTRRSQAVGQSAGGLGVDGVAFLAHEHHDGHRDRGQRPVIGQEALVAPELDPEEGLGTGLHARP